MSAQASRGCAPAVVIPRGGAWGERVASAARARGLEPLVLPLIRSAPPVDAGPLDAAVAMLVEGAPTQASWLVVTSATTVRVVAERLDRPPAAKVAAVGEATASAARERGWTVDLVPASHSGAGLVAAFPDTAGRVIVPHADLASDTVAAGLAARGVDVVDVVAYRTVSTGDEPIRFDPQPAAVLITSGSVAREVARRMGPPAAETATVCIGGATARAAEAAGLRVDVVAGAQTAEAMLDEVVARISREHRPRTAEQPTGRRS